MKNARIWVSIQGRIYKSTLCQPVPPPPPYPGIDGVIPEGTAYGLMTHDETQDLPSKIRGYSTLCIMPRDGLQVVMLERLAWRKAKEAIDGQLPGMTFYPWLEDPNSSDGVSRVLLIGYGESFADLFTEDATASCAPGIAFPVGRFYAEPIRNRSGARIEDMMRDWIAPDMKTLENIRPVVEYVRSLNLTDKDRADFRASEILEAEEDERQIQENIAWWAAKHAAGETVFDLVSGLWRVKPDVQTNPAARELLP